MNSSIVKKTESDDSTKNIVRVHKDLVLIVLVLLLINSVLAADVQTIR